MEELLIPSQIQFEEGKDKNHGTVTVSPCYHGYGTTLGNALRRVLLSSLPGAAVTGVRVKGVQHEFSTISGVKEDMVEIILNLKEIDLRCFAPEVTVTLKTKGKKEVTAGDIETNADVEIINKDLHLFTVTDDKAVVEMELTVGQGRGYVPVEERDKKSLPLGTIAIDAVYNPVKDVGYKVEFTRVGDITNFEKLVMDIETDGSITPKEAINQALELIMKHFTVISDNVKN
jgi:DNA-directed RNA polymerase subunit alpha